MQSQKKKRGERVENVLHHRVRVGPANLPTMFNSWFKAGEKSLKVLSLSSEENSDVISWFDTQEKKVLMINMNLARNCPSWSICSISVCPKLIALVSTASNVLLNGVEEFLTSGSDSIIKYTFFKKKVTNGHELENQLASWLCFRFMSSFYLSNQSQRFFSIVLINVPFGLCYFWEIAKHLFSSMSVYLKIYPVIAKWVVKQADKWNTPN